MPFCRVFIKPIGSFNWAEYRSKDENRPAEQILQEMKDCQPHQGPLATPGNFGAMAAFLSSDQAGYINGQSILIDGGSFPGLM